MTNRTTFNGYMTAVANEAHPLQSTIRFVFTDFQPNSNGEGVQLSEAENIIRTGINMPVKVNFSDGAPSIHDSATPIGPITKMWLEDNRILGEAILWKDEFPDVIAYFEKSTSEDKPIQFSWEIFYKIADFSQEGVTWLKDVIVGGIAAVANPAYRGRTPMLSIAEQTPLARFVDDLTNRVKTIEETLGIQSQQPLLVSTEQLYASRSDVVEDAVDQTSTSADTSQETQVVDKSPSVDPAIMSELETLRQFKAEKDREEQESKLAESRFSAISSLNISRSSFDTNRDFYLSMSDEMFEKFKTIISTYSPATSETKAEASDKGSFVPDASLASDESELNPKSIGKALRSIK